MFERRIRVEVLVKFQGHRKIHIVSRYILIREYKKYAINFTLDCCFRSLK